MGGGRRRVELDPDWSREGGWSPFMVPVAVVAGWAGG